MTDEQIIKALELCFSENFGKCEICPLEKQRDEVFTCIKTKQKNALDLINRQKAEIERLKKENERFADIGKMYSEIRAEVVKEFAEKYKEHIKNFTGRFTDGMGFMVNLDAILFAVDFVADNLVKEMTEPVKIEHNSLCETETYMGE